MTVAAEIFREYDIRGVAGRDLTAAFAFDLGRAIATRLGDAGGRRLVVGRDGRASGVELGEALIAGLLRSGAEVLDIGLTPTPVGYWAIRDRGADGGVQVTGSHNPPEYNGFKVTLLGESVHGDGIRALRDVILAQRFRDGAGRRETTPVLAAYGEDLAQLLRPAGRRFKVVIDAGNGTGGLTAVPLYRRLGYEVEPLYCDPDAGFPHHHPDPTVPENLSDLQAAVARTGADLGIAFDGDADRIGVVEPDGTIVWGDRLLILLARAVLREEPGATVIGEVKCSKTLYDDIARHGGKPLMWRTGHSLIKAKIKETRAALAGEMSGHIFFAHRYYGFDDAVYAGGRLLEILSRGEGSLSERLADVPATVSTPEIRSECPEAVKFALVAAVTRRLKAAAASEGFSVIDIDGARAEWADGFGLVRPSNTQPLLVLRFEATTAARLAAIRARVERELDAARRELGG